MSSYIIAVALLINMALNVTMLFKFAPHTSRFEWAGSAACVLTFVCLVLHMISHYAGGLK